LQRIKPRRLTSDGRDRAAERGGRSDPAQPVGHRRAASRLTDRVRSATSTTFPPARLDSD